jgi:hypothetical protein
MAGKPFLPSEWAPVTAPALVIAGEKSPAQLRQAAGALAAVPPNSEHCLLEGQSHKVSMPALASVLKTFFANGWPRGAE